MTREMGCNTEIERKFLVVSDAFISEATEQHHIKQAYLCKDAERTIRIRIRDEQAFLTVKSSHLREGIAKYEWEKEIDPADAEEMMAICLPGVIEKTRYVIMAHGAWRKDEGQGKGTPLKWEVDVFHGRLEGRVLAEIELEDENEPFEKPKWLGEEVTGQPEYYNANM